MTGRAIRLIPRPRFPRRAPVRGFTMVEVIVYAVLISLLMTILYTMFVMFLRSSRMVQAETDLENSATSGILHMVADVADTDSGSVTIGTSPNGIIMASPRDALDRFQRDASGSLYWQKWVCYYIESSNISGTGGRLKRVQVTLPAPSITPTASTNNTAWFAALPGARTVAENLTALQFSGTNPVRITATFTRSVFNTDDAQISITDSVNPRN